IASGNPLAAAIRAAQQELNSRAAAAGNTDPPDPYPLLVVRPDGVTAYEVALAAARTWDSDFGYEVVDADWKLAYPAADPLLAQAMNHAVLQARERQQLLAEAAPRRYGGRASAVGGAGGAGAGRGKGRGSGRGVGEFSDNGVQLASETDGGGDSQNKP